MKQEILGANNKESNIVNDIAYTLLVILYNNQDMTQKSLHALKAISVISYVAKIQKGDARNVALCCMDVVLSYPPNRAVALEDVGTLSCLFTILFEPELKEFSLQHIQEMMAVKSDDYNLYEMLFSAYTDAFLRILSNPNEDSYHLLLKMLKTLQQALQQKTSRALQRQYRSRLDRIVHLLNFNCEGISRHELCIQVLRTLTLLLNGTHGSKRVMKQLGYNALRDLIFMCESGEPASDTFDELFNMVRHNDLFPAFLYIYIYIAC